METSSRFYIVNCVDRPYPRHIVQRLKDNTGVYIHPDLVNYPSFTFNEEWTDVEDFGIAIDIEDGVANFDVVQPSDATYLDGQKREWQGDHSFSLKIIEE